MSREASDPTIPAPAKLTPSGKSAKSKPVAAAVEFNAPAAASAEQRGAGAERIEISHSHSPLVEIPGLPSHAADLSGRIETEQPFGDPDVPTPGGWRPEPATKVLQNVVLRDGVPLRIPIDARSCFVNHYPEILTALNAHRAPGLLMVAVDSGSTVLDSAWIKASLDRPHAALIGRHNRCALSIPFPHGDVSLRHLAVMVRALSPDKVRLRILDLRTKSGFHDELGEEQRAISCDGSLFIRVAGVTLILLVTGAEQSWPEEPAEAYAQLPEPVLVQGPWGAAGSPRRSSHGRGQGAREITVVHQLEGPVAVAGELCRSFETAHGTLEVALGEESLRLPVSEASLQRGILIGRYDRCDIGMTNVSDSKLSRVHMLLVKDGDDLLALDTASSNGTTLHGKPVNLLRLREGDTLDLGTEMDLTWRGAE